MEIKIVIFALSKTCLNVLMLREKAPTSPRRFSLPWGLLEPHETLEMATQRIYCGVVALENIFLEQTQTFVYPVVTSEQQRIQILYSALVNRNKCPIESYPLTHEKKWFPVSTLPGIQAPDSNYVTIALKKLQEKVRYQPIGIYQLPEVFELPELQKVYEMILGKRLDQDLFRSKIYGTDLLIPLSEKGTYRFNVKRYFDLKQKGFYLNI